MAGRVIGVCNVTGNGDASYIGNGRIGDGTCDEDRKGTGSNVSGNGGDGNGV